MRKRVRANYGNEHLFEYLYINQKKSMLMVSKYFNTNYSVVRNYFINKGIKIRTRSEARKGKKHSEEVRRKIGDGNRGKYISEEMKNKISKTMKGKYVGDKAPNWKGGISFDPYCPAFNNEIKEKIRNRDNRVCQLCGKSEILNGRKLDVHHIDGDKMQGCDGKDWYLVSLCRSCNVKADTIEKEFLIVSNMRY